MSEVSPHLRKAAETLAAAEFTDMPDGMEKALAIYERQMEILDQWAQDPLLSEGLATGDGDGKAFKRN